MAIDLGDRIIVAENVEVDMDTLRRAKDIGHEMPHKRLEAALEVIKAVEKALYPDDRKRLELYMRGNDATI